LGQKTQSRLDDTSTETQNQVKGGLFLNVVIGESTAILKLLASEDQTLLIWRNTFLVLDLGLDILDGISWFNIKSDGLSCQSFDENLHTTSQSEDQMKSGFLLDVVVGESSSILKLLSGEDKSLLIWGNTFLVLDLGFNILDGVCWFNIKGDGLTSQSLNENLHTTS